MIGNKIYTGLVVDDDFLKVARIRVSNKKVTLLSIDKVRLVDKINKKGKQEEKQESEEDIFGGIDESLDDEDTIFGLEEESDEVEEEEGAEIDLENFDDDLGDLDFDDLESGDEIIDTDMADEAEAPASNELLLYNILSSASTKRADVGVSIPAGKTIFQILRDVDFSDTKKKDLQVIVDDRLESLHGTSKGQDYYSYSVREDGALLLTSIDDEPDLIKLLNRTQDVYNGKLFINDVLPEEVILLGLIRANYELDENSITGVIQFGETSSRVLFMRGNQLWIVSPIISEGTKNPKFLNTVFSKILFQLDTGEVPNLDRIIICNNSMGDTAIEFFEERFQDVDVTEFSFSDDLFETEEIKPGSISAFTTAIGSAWIASGFRKDDFPNISFLPNYIIDRQKIFKLQWHGFMLLLFILFTPIITNHFYTQNAAEIDRLRSEVNTLDSQIESLEPTVQRYNQISSELNQIQVKLRLLGELSQGTVRWTKNLDLLNRGYEDVNSIWLSSMSEGQNSNIDIDGIAIYRNRIKLLANTFQNATLLNVSSSEIREEEVYDYRFVINQFYNNDNIYTPESVQGINELIQE